MPCITILLANAHPIIRSSLRSLLEREPDFTVVGEASTGREAVILADFKRPSVVVLDMKLSVLTGIETARTIESLRAGSAILFHAAQTDLAYISAAFDAGARGYVGADSAPAELARAVRIVASGLRYISPSISRCLVEEDHQQPSTSSLSEHDKTICCLLAAGYRFPELARYLGCESACVVGSDDDYLNRSLQWGSVPDVIAVSVLENQRRLRNT